MIAWWVCAILCFVSAWVGFFLAGLMFAAAQPDEEQRYEPHS